MNNTTTNKNLWEEKNLIEVNLNLLNKSESEMPVITPSTESELEKKECENTGKKWTKNCPDCGRLQAYSIEQDLSSAIKKNRKCRKCSGRKIPTPSEGWTRKCPKCPAILKYTRRENWWAANKANTVCRSCKPVSEKVRTQLANFNRGRIKSPAEIEKQRRAQTGRKHSDASRRKKSENRAYITDDYRKKLSVAMTDKVRTDATRNKIRILKLQRVKDLGGFPSFNPKACEFMELLNKTYGYKFQHALNGGEVSLIGYSVDGYDREKNIVFEYDESRHENPTRKLKDMKRTENLINNIRCDIIRYSERCGCLYKSYVTHSEIINYEYKI